MLLPPDGAVWAGMWSVVGALVDLRALGLFGSLALLLGVTNEELLGFLLSLGEVLPELLPNRSDVVLGLLGLMLSRGELLIGLSLS